MNIIVNGQLVEYTDQGKGPVALLLHGWGTTSKSLEVIANALAENHRVLRLDFPGFGGSPRPQQDWFIEDYAAFVGDFLKKIGTQADIVIGHSFGGRVIIKSIATGILNPQKVVLIGAAGVKPNTSAKKAVFRVIAKTGKAVTSLPGLRKLQGPLKKSLYSAAGSTDYLNAGAMQKIFINTVNEDLLPLVRRIKQPTLLVWGEHDDQTPVQDAHKMKAELKNSKLVVIPDAGHYVFLDKTPEVVKALKEFL